jgi:Holliday junction DNA helicase RuvA
MISSLNGLLIEKHPTRIILSVHGVGYEVFIPLSTYSTLPDIQKDSMILTHLHVREDAWTLYGFATSDERDLFRLLISISGIGPKVALTVLSGIGIDNFKNAIAENDVTRLTSISGVGKKTAERMIIELKDKIKIVLPKGAAREQDASVYVSDVMTDAVNALVALGYKKNQAEDAIKKVLKARGDEPVGVEDIIRLSLQFV